MSPPNRPPNRRQQDPRLDRIEQYLEHIQSEQEAIKHRGSLLKNGDSWKDYLGKVFTVDRILLLILLIYQFGGQVATFNRERSDVLQSQASLTKQHDTVLQQMKAAQELQSDTGEAVLTLYRETDRLAKVSRQLEDRMNRTVTRSEFQSTVQQRLLPRLERIEKALGTK